MITELMTAEMTCDNSDQISNALVRQKDAIREMVNGATDADEFTAILAQLLFVAELWLVLDYGYKIYDIASEVAERCLAAYQCAEDVLSNLRKNANDRNSWQTEADELQRLTTVFRKMAAIYRR